MRRQCGHTDGTAGAAFRQFRAVFRERTPPFAGGIASAARSQPAGGLQRGDVRPADRDLFSAAQFQPPLPVATVGRAHRTRRDPVRTVHPPPARRRQLLERRRQRAEDQPLPGRGVDAQVVVLARQRQQLAGQRLRDAPVEGIRWWFRPRPQHRDRDHRAAQHGRQQRHAQAQGHQRRGLPGVARQEHVVGDGRDDPARHRVGETGHQHQHGQVLPGFEVTDEPGSDDKAAHRQGAVEQAQQHPVDQPQRHLDAVVGAERPQQGQQGAGRDRRQQSDRVPHGAEHAGYEILTAHRQRRLGGGHGWPGVHGKRLWIARHRAARAGVPAGPCPAPAALRLDLVPGRHGLRLGTRRLPRPARRLARPVVRF